MRQIKRDQKTLTYQLYGVAQGEDKFGNVYYGYSKRKEAKYCRKAGTGATEDSVFGLNITFDFEITTYKDYGFDEHTKLYIGSDEYKIKAIAPSSSIYRYAIAKVSK